MSEAFLLALVLVWFGVTVWSMFPTGGVYENRVNIDTNRYRFLLSLLSVLVLPTMILWHMASTTGVFEWSLDPFPVEFVLGAAALMIIGHVLRAWFLRHTPDVEADRAFHEWVETLKDGEAHLHLFPEGKYFDQYALRKAWVWVALGVVILAATVWVAGLFFAPTAAAFLGQDARVWGTVVVAFVISQLQFWSAPIVYWRLLTEQGTSLPVRYSLFGDQVVRFLLSSWLIAYPFIALFEWSAVPRSAPWIVALIIAGGLAFMATVIWPFANWRVRFREERQNLLGRFARMMDRVVSNTGKAGAESDFEKKARRKSLEDMEQLFIDIVEQSRFRAYVALNAHRFDRRAAMKPALAEARRYFVEVWYAGKKKGEPTPHRLLKDATSEEEYKRAKEATDVLDHIANKVNGVTPFERFLITKAMAFSRVRMAHDLGDVRLLTQMVRRRLKDLEQSDYRYRLMRWIGRVMTDYDNDILRAGFAADAKKDVEARMRQTDRRSFGLAITAAVSAAVFGWLFAVYDQDLRAGVRDIIDLGGYLRATVAPAAQQAP